jgi:2-enoate reductase
MEKAADRVIFMAEMKYPELFKPLKIGTLELKNRIVMSPMDTKHQEPYMIWGDDTIAYYEERAKGGAGLIVTYACPALDRVEESPLLMSPFDKPEECRRQMKKLVAACHKYDCKLFIQLWSGFGRIAFPLGMNNFVAPSEGPNLWDPEIQHRALTTEEIRRIIRSHIDAAEVCKECGADGVNIVAAYGGYMGDQFSTSLFNHRTDEYGGDINGRARITVETIEGIKKRCGSDFPVTCRFTTRHHMPAIHHGQVPGTPYKEIGRDVPESIELGKIFEKAGCDAFLIGNGCYDALFWQYSPMYLPEGEWLDDVRPFTAQMDVPVICPGRILRPEMANEAIRNGTIDAVALGRALLADPQWPNKAFRGEADDIRPCIGCNNGCIGRVMSAQPLMCAVNPDIFNERNQELIPAAVPKNVAVIGAGIGGMEAARILKMRGHNVTIYEKSNEAGGLFLAASAPDFKQGDRRLIKWYLKKMGDLGIEIKYGQDMSAEDVKSLGAEEVIVATGTSPKMLPIPGIENANVIFAEDFLRGRKTAGRKVVILGGGWVGCEVALWLSEDPNTDVSIVEMTRGIMTGGNIQPPAMNLAYMEEVLNFRSNVHILLRTQATSFSAEGVNVTTKRAGDSFLPCDTVILCVGLAPNRSIYDQLKESMGDHVHLIGDADSPGIIMTAVQQANEVARKI